MPEGPEIRRAADRIGRAIRNRVLTDVYFAFERLQPHAPHLVGEPVARVYPRGKAFLIDVGDFTIYTHNQLYGRWYVKKSGETPHTNRSLRLALHTGHRDALLYSASDIEVWPRGTIDDHPYIRKLGPDVLDEETPTSAIRARYFDETYRRRKLAGLLLDQGFIAGLGNYLRSEILFEAGVHPSRRPMDLSDEAREALADATVLMVTRGYTQAGVTTAREFMIEQKGMGRRKASYRHYVFARADKPCRRCGTTIDRLEMAGRRVFVCPRCQPHE